MRRFTISLLILVSLLVPLSWTQSTKSSPTLNIIVKDPTGAPIPGAEVMIVWEASPQRLKTNPNGMASADLQRPSFEVLVTANGFRTQKKTFISADPGNQSIEFALHVGGGSSVEVEKTHGSAEEEAVWNLEDSYWKDVQRYDLEAYRALWNTDFLGWPFVSSEPVRKSGITDWITDMRNKGLHLAAFRLQPAGSRHYDNYVVTFYSLTARWVDKDGHGEPSSSRITHTWMKSGANWQIISGMSAALDGKR